MVAAINATFGLHAYQAWRKSLIPLPVGTILHWVKGRSGATQSSTIKANSYTKIIGLHSGFMPVDKTDASKSYELKLCNKNGKEFARTEFYNVEGIARYIELEEIKIKSN